MVGEGVVKASMIIPIVEHMAAHDVRLLVIAGMPASRNFSFNHPLVFRQWPAPAISSSSFSMSSNLSETRNLLNQSWKDSASD
jgi:hypothetical protein